MFSSTAKNAEPAPTPITVAYGDGIGPEIMEAVLKILRMANAGIQVETIEIGQKLYEMGHSSGLAPNAWDSLERTRVFLKAPITTPQGGGYKSLNVTVRKSLGLFANVRPCVSYAPYVKSLHPDMNLVIVRENEEDLYAGIEHRQTDDAFQALKLLTVGGTEKICRYAFEYAVQNDRKKVTCMVKDNIMKLCDGMFANVFREVAQEYKQIESETFIIDIGSARIASRPSQFDVIVTLNLYGDIISDIAAEVSGSVGLAGSANIGRDFAMFEAIHGSAPDIAGQGIANPSGLLHGAIMMLVHIGDVEAATNIHNAWLRTIEDGMHTGDIYREGHSAAKLGTMEFADAVIERLGEKPEKEFTPVHYKRLDHNPADITLKQRPPAKKELVGVDMFIHAHSKDVESLGGQVNQISGDGLTLKLITSRGLKIWPERNAAAGLSDHWRCRFVAEQEGGTITHDQIIALLTRARAQGLDFVKTEQLYTFDGERGYSLAQGE